MNLYTEPHMNYHLDLLKIYGPRTLNNLENISLDEVLQKAQYESQEDDYLKNYEEEKSKITREHAIKIACWMAKKNRGIKDLAKRIPGVSIPNLLRFIKDEMDPQFLKYREFTKFDLLKMIQLYKKYGDENFDKIVDYFDGQGKNFLKRCFCMNLYNFSQHLIKKSYEKMETTNIHFMVKSCKEKISKLKRLTPYSPISELFENHEELVDRLIKKYPDLKN